MDKITAFLKKNWMYFTGALIGVIGGYLYWANVGCLSGTCPITSSPVMSVIWGGVMGSLLFSIIFGKKTNKE